VSGDAKEKKGDLSRKKRMEEGLKERGV